MSAIEEKVVSARFNNAQFEANAKTTLGTLSALSKGLKLDGASRGLENVSAAAKNANLGTLASAVDGLSNRFSAMSVIGVTALATIANKAVNAGMAMAQSLTIAPIKAGFDEYELKLGSIQTMLANTARYGTKLPEISRNLEELNNYADKTIYNFGDMTKNIGLFTNAGIKIGDATKMIQGFSNVAAASGTSAMGAAGAAYQLSQALSAGKITLMDWKSLTNVGMGNANMRDSLVDIAKAMGTLNKHGTTAKEVQSNFNGSLQKGWLEAKVMNKYLKIMATDFDIMSKKELESQKAKLRGLGLSNKVINRLIAEQKMAQKSATEVRTFSQLIGTVRESIGSGWSETFEIVFGNFKEATMLFTDINNAVGKITGGMTESRNDLLKGWAKKGGRIALIDGLKNGFQALGIVIKSIKDGFTSVFPPTTVDQLVKMTKNFRDFTASLKMGGENADRLKRTFAGVFAIFKVGYTIISGVFKALFSLFGIAQSGSGGFLAMTAAVGDFLVSIEKWLVTSGRIKSFFATIDTARSAILVPLVAVIGDVVEAFSMLFKGDTEGFVNKLKEAFGGLGELINGVWESATSSITGYLSNARDAAGVASEFLKGLGIKAIEPFQRGLAKLSDNLGKLKVLIQNFGFDAFKKGSQGAASGLSAASSVIDQVKSTWQGLLDIFSGVSGKLGPILGSIGNLFTTITDKLAQFIEGMDMQDAVALLNTGMFILMYKSIKDFMDNLSTVADSFKGIAESIKGAFGQLTDTLKTMQKDVQANIILKIAIAVGVLVASLYVLAQIDAGKLITGIIAIGVLIKMLNMSMGYLAELQVADNAKIMQAAAGMILLAVAIRILAGAVAKISELSWGEMIKGLVGVGALLAGLTLFSKYAQANEGALASGAGLVLMAVAIRILVSSVSEIAKMSVSDILKGLLAIQTLMAGLAAMTLVMNNTKGVFQAAAGLLVLSAAMAAMSVVLRIYAAMDWSTILKGLGAVVLSIAGIGIAMQTLPKNGAAQLIGASIALTILAGALRLIGTMKLADIAKGVLAITAMLTAVVIAVNLLNGAMLGAQALLLISASLLVFAGAMKVLGELSWEAIGKGLTAIVGLLVILGLAGLVMGPVIPVIIALGAALALLGQAMLWAGAGFLAFATGFAILGTVGAAGFAVLTAGFMGLMNLIPLFAQQVGLGIRAIAVVIAQSGPQIYAAMTTFMLALLKAIDTVAPKLMDTTTKLIIGLLNVIVALAPRFYEAGLKLIKGFLQALARQIGPIVKAGADVIVNFLKGLQKEVPRITDQAAKTIIAFVQGTADAINRNSKAMDDAGRDLASAIIQGMVRGLTAGVRWVVDAAAGMARSALQAARDILHIKSPSREFAKLGKFSAEGFAKGIRDSKSVIDASMKQMRTLLTETVDATADDIKNAESRLKKLTSARKKDAEAIKDARKDLAQAKSEHAKALAAQKLVKTYGDEQKKLVSLADSYDKVGEKLKDAKKMLDDATKARDDFNTSTKESFNNLPDISKETKLSDFVADLEKQVINTQLFTAQLAELRKQGLSDGVYKLLLAKGTEAMPFAEQLLVGGKSAIDQVNTLDSALNKAADTLGSNASTALYQAGVDAAAGLVKGLEKEQAAIQAQMDKIADGMVAAIKKKLGIKSPSRKFMEVGDWSIKGLAAGLSRSSSISEAAAEGVGHDTINSLRKTLSGLSDVVGSELNVDPTIRPVLDLTQVQKDAVKMGDLLQASNLSVGAAFAKAKNLSVGYDNNRALASQTTAPQAAGKSITYNQYNNSPKALSSATIYRNTKNLISTTKGALKT